MSAREHPDVTDYRIAASVLTDIVHWSLAGDERIRVHQGGMMRGPGIEVSVEGNACTVTVPIDARFGENLQALGAEVRDTVADALGTITGLEVEAVDVIVSGVYPARTRA